MLFRKRANPTIGPDLRSRPAILILALFTLTLLLAPGAGATPPSAMSLHYDRNAGLLSVTITHATLDVRTHYIREVAVSLNGQMLNDSHYTSQPDPDTFTYTFPVVAHPGDVLEATATCNLIGSASRSITVTDGTTTVALPDPAATTRKSSLGILPLAGLAILYFSRKIAGR